MKQCQTRSLIAVSKVGIFKSSLFRPAQLAHRGMKTLKMQNGSDWLSS